MRAYLIFVYQLAIEMRDAVVQDGGAGGVDRVADVCELPVAYLAREAFGQLALRAGQHVDAKNVGSSDEQIAACFAIDADQERRRFERNASKRIDRDAARFAVFQRRYDGDAGRNAAHRMPKVGGTGHFRRAPIPVPSPSGRIVASRAGCVRKRWTKSRAGRQSLKIAKPESLSIGITSSRYRQ